MARPQQQQQQQQGSPSKARRPAKRGGKEAPPTPLQALAALDARLSNVLYRRGTSVPRLVWRAFELSGDGLVWLAWASGMAAAPGTPPPTRAVWLNFLLAWAVDLILVGVGFRLAYRVGAGAGRCLCHAAAAARRHCSSSHQSGRAAAGAPAAA